MGQIPFYRQGDNHATVDRRWDLTISQESSAPWPSSPTLQLDADSPLTFEWDDAKPQDVIEGSTATLRLVSPSDRFFADLYTIDPLGVTLEVKAGGVTVWRGSLDPELYEEPYSMGSGYTVDLTFSDLAPMKDRDFEGSGHLAFDTLLRSALGHTALGGDYGLMTSTRILTGGGSGVTMQMGQLCISADNFTDEDGTPMKMSEAVESILRPFGLHMRQFGGRAWIYDYHTLATGQQQPRRLITWTSTDSMMSMADIAHKVTIRYSPYADTTLADGTVEAAALSPSSATDSLSVYTDDGLEDSPRIHGFTIYAFEGVESPNPTLDPCGNTLYRIVAGHSGQSGAGILGLARQSRGMPSPHVLAGGTGVSTVQTPSAKKVMTLTGPWLTAPADSTDYLLKVSMSFMLDVRANPFEGAERRNEKGNYERLTNWANFGYVPCALEVVDDTGRAIAHYANRAVKDSDSCSQVGAWRPGAASPGDMWLAYYDTGNRKSASGWGGFKTNRQTIGYWRDTLPAIFTKRGDGEYVPYPSLSGMVCNGRLRLTVYAGVDWWDYGRAGQSAAKDLDSRWMWCLYGAPSIEVVRDDGTEIATEDVIYTATAIEGAASDIDIDLTSGSSVEAPTARAVILTRVENSSGQTALRQAGADTFGRVRSGRVEELLLDTLVSQYDSPHVMLTGEADLAPMIMGAPTGWRDAAQDSDRVFIPTALAADARLGTAQTTYRQISPDSYTPSE